MRLVGRERNIRVNKHLRLTKSLYGRMNTHEEHVKGRKT